MGMQFYVDLHDHITTFPFNVGKRNTEINKMTYRNNKGLGADTQSDLLKLTKGGVRVVFASVCPVETGFMKVRNSEGYISDEGIHRYTGFDEDLINDIQTPGHSYFNFLKNEINMLASDEGKELSFSESSLKCKYKIVKNYADLKSFLEIDSDYNVAKRDIKLAKIAVILTIEGVHSFFPRPLEEYTCDFNDMNDEHTKALFDIIRTNITSLSANKPFSVTFAHHFYNKLCGQSISFTNIINQFVIQDEHSTEGFSELGKSIVRELYNQNIIIDVRHLSIPSRKWLYSQDFSRNKPVIVSHSAVNGCKTMDESMERNNTHKIAQQKFRDSKVFNNWDINLSDQEIVEIAKRDGLIGLSLDQRIIMGKENIRNVKLLSKIPFNRKDAWCKPLYQNAVYIANIIASNGIDKKKIWDNLSIGSDFDGMINPINGFASAEQFPGLEETLVSVFLKNKKKEPLLKEKSDMEITFIVRKIMCVNAMKFLEKNFI